MAVLSAMWVDSRVEWTARSLVALWVSRTAEWTDSNLALAMADWKVDDSVADSDRQSVDNWVSQTVVMRVELTADGWESLRTAQWV